jgi:hypothetical protein
MPCIHILNELCKSSNMLSRVNLCVALQWYLGSLGKLSVPKFVDALDTASKIGIETCTALLGAKNIVRAHIQEYGCGGMVDYRPSRGDAAHGPRWVFTPFRKSNFSFQELQPPTHQKIYGLGLFHLSALGAQDTYLTHPKKIRALSHKVCYWPSFLRRPCRSEMLSFFLLLLGYSYFSNWLTCEHFE